MIREELAESAVILEAMLAQYPIGPVSLTDEIPPEPDYGYPADEYDLRDHPYDHEACVHNAESDDTTIAECTENGV